MTEHEKRIADVLQTSAELAELIKNQGEREDRILGLLRNFEKRLSNLESVTAAIVEAHGKLGEAVLGHQKVLAELDEQVKRDPFPGFGPAHKA